MKFFFSPNNYLLSEILTQQQQQKYPSAIFLFLPTLIKRHFATKNLDVVLKEPNSTKYFEDNPPLPQLK